MDTKVDSKNRLSDLEAWLEKIEALGLLKRITAEVDPDLESSTVAYLSGKEIGSPALLFENIKGHPGGRARCIIFSAPVWRVSAWPCARSRSTIRST